MTDKIFVVMVGLLLLVVVGATAFLLFGAGTALGYLVDDTKKSPAD